jgi:hypothetical protein
MDHLPASPDTWTAADQRALSYAIIEAANLWESYCRSFYISSALQAREASGQRVQLTYGAPIRTPDEAITAAVHRIDPSLRGTPGPYEPRDEPDWQGQLRTCLSNLGASNLPKVERAVGLLPEALNHLRTTRNYFAHKGERNAKKVRSLHSKYGLLNPVHPVELLFSPARSKKGFQTGEPVILRWFGVLYRTIRLTIDPVAGSP